MSRVGNFTSSQIYRLMSKGRGNWSIENIGAPFNSYIKEKLREIKTGRPITSERTGNAAKWGTFMESWVFNNKIDFKYDLISKKRYYHPKYRWSGMPDTLKKGLTALSKGIIGDIKNPYTITSFCDAVDSFESVELFKSEKPEWYWQLLSNSILCGVEEVEMLVHMPYKDELEAIKEATSLFEGDQNKIAWIYYADDEELPYLNRDCFYKDLNFFKFKVPEQDRTNLISRVKMANNILEKEIKLLTNK